MNKNELQSARKLNTRETKDKILKSTLKLMNNFGYKYLTIRNICKMANVSTGTFYHHFRTKDDLISHYIAEGYERYMKENLPRLQQLDIKDWIIEIYTWFASYFSERDVEFVSSYFSSKNPVLNLRNLSPGLQINFRQLVYDIVSKIESAQKNGQIIIEMDAANIFHELNMVFFGTIFDWCLCLGNYDLAKQVNKMIKIALNYYLIDQPAK